MNQQPQLVIKYTSYRGIKSSCAIRKHAETPDRGTSDEQIQFETLKRHFLVGCNGRNCSYLNCYLYSFSGYGTKIALSRNEI